jgi:hypothetical protein
MTLIGNTPGGTVGSGTSTNPFENAAQYTQEVQTFVESQIGAISDILSTYLSQASSAINGLGNYTIVLPDVGVEPPELDFSFGFDPTVPTVPTPDFGRVTPWDVGSRPSYSGPSSISVPGIPAFNPSITTIAVPPAPAPAIISPPGPAPTVTVPDFPDVPTLALPNKPTLINVTIPAAPTITIPAFDPELPDFQLPAAPNAGLEWTEEDYEPTVLNSVIDQIETFFAGGTGIRPDVQDQIFNQAADREDRVANVALREAETEVASRGYRELPGVLLKRMDAIRSERDRNKSALNRELLIKVMDSELENLRFAVTAGIQAEDLLVRIFLAAQDRLFLAARLTVEFGINLYQAQVAAYTAALEGVRTQAEVYRATIEGRIAQVQVYESQVQAALATAQVNESLVRAYVAEVESLQTLINLYEAELRAVQTRVEIDAVRVRAFGEEVDAYAAQVAADKTRFDAYESRIRGELGKASILESEARAYAAEVGGISSGTTAQARAFEANIGRYQADIQAYVGEANARAARSNAEAQGIQGNASAYTAASSRFNALVGLQEALGRIEVAAWEAGNRQQIEAYRARIAESEVNLRRIIEEARLGLQALDSAGRLSTTVAGGAMAAINVGATISGNGSTSASGNVSESYSNSSSASVSSSSNSECSITQIATETRNADEGFIGPPWGSCGEP